MAADPKALDCLACPALCCRQAGYVEVTVRDVRRLAKFLGLTVRAFEAKHIVEKTRRGSKRIKAGYETCQFLDNDRRCSVYAARPKDCRGYVCWNQPDTTLFEFAKFLQKPVDRLREQERREAAAEKK
ncbi:MAG TPA: YkgJ family cysteine cluster protein [Acetobacteraceae bacterium]|jgi:Fe-S-cluster containining protein|nr:YkgJ family cysteine cluster protein [Acetobacteraceae bacterium]